MESGDRLDPPSPASSLHMASSSTSSSPAPPKALTTKSSPAHSTEIGSHLTACENVPQMTRDERGDTSDSSNGFNVTSHPAFGLGSSSSTRSEFGGLGSLGLSAMAAHSQFGTFPDWWRPPEAHTRGAAAFFPPLLGLHPAFVSSLTRHDAADSQSCTSGVNGAVNGRSASSSAANAVVSTSLFPAKVNKGKTQADGSRCQKSSHELGHPHLKTNQRTKEKKPHKRQAEMSSMSGSQSESLTESSTDGEESSSDNMEEEDDDDDDDDLSSDIEDSDSEKESAVKRLTQNESKKNRPCAADRNTAQDRHCDSVPLTSTYHIQTGSPPAGLPCSSSLFLQSPRISNEENKPHISVIQTTGLTIRSSYLSQSQREARLLPCRSLTSEIFSNSSKHVSSLTSTKHVPSLSSSKHSSFASSSQPLALCSRKKSLFSSPSPQPSPSGSVSSLSPPALPKAPAQLASTDPSNNATFLMPSSRLVQPVDNDLLTQSRGNHQEGIFQLTQPLNPKDSVKQTFPSRPKSQSCGDTNLFLNPHSNGAINMAVQDAPLALITKPQHQSSATSSKPLAASSPPYPVPMNLSIGSRDVLGTSAFPHKSSASSGLPAKLKKTKSPKSVNMGKTLTKTNSPLARGSESDFHSSKDSDDSFGDDNDDDEDSGSSISELESNLESDSDASEGNVKECMEMEADSDVDRTVPKTAEVSSIPKSSSSLDISTYCSLLNLQITKVPGLHSSLETATASTTTWNKDTPTYSFVTVPGSGKRRRVTDEQVLRLPLDFGWRRETRIRMVAGRLQGEVAYFAPCGKKMRQYPDVMKYLVRNGITEISRDNFSFSTKIKVGDFYEAREGSEGMQWYLLPEDEIVPIIIAMDGRRSRSSKFELQPLGDGSAVRQWKSHPPNVGEKNSQRDIGDAKLLRKLEAQEIARQAAQIKMMRKLEKQAMAQAAKEAKKQQALIAAEERRKKREQIKILKQEEKIKRIQQIRMEKELRAQQILEAKRKKKEAAANAKIMEAEKRNKEKEIRRLQAVIQKHQELERHRLDMERERRRQHMVLMKAVEARKKAEERERLKKEKKDEKRLNKERKLELRRLEQEKAKELKKPNEDLCLADHKPLPELSGIPGLVLSGRTFSDCLMVLQFLHNFGKVLGSGLANSNMVTMNDLQEGLLNIGKSMNIVQDLLVKMLSAALSDPGMPAGHKSKTILGDNLTNVEINQDNVSEILQLYMEAHSEQTEAAFSLRTKAFQAHSPSQKASILAFLVNELCCSKAVISEIDKNIDYMTNLRKDNWAVEGKLRKLRSIHSKRTGKKDSSVGAEDNHTLAIPTIRNKRKRKEGDSEDDDDEDEDSDDQGDDDEEDEDESGAKKGKKVDMCDEEDDSVHSASIEELEKQIEKVYKQQSQIRQKMFDSSHSLRSMMIGQDRYKRRYWVLPHCHGIFVEGLGSAEGSEEIEERKQLKAIEEIKVEEAPLEEANEPGVSTTSMNSDKPVPDFQKDKDNLFLQKPDSLSKLSTLLEVAKMAQDSSVNSQNSHSAEVFTSAPYPLYPTSQTVTTRQGPADKTDALAPSLLTDSQLKSSQWMNPSPQSVLHCDQLSKILTEKNNQWFSLLPRSPCEESSVTSGCSPSASFSPQPARDDSPSVLSSNPAAGADCRAGINNMLSPIHQPVQCGIHQSRLPLSGMFSPAATPSAPFFGTSPSPVLGHGFQHVEGDGNKANSNIVNKSETPAPATDDLTTASFCAVDMVKTLDYSTLQPIPEEMLRGWWTVSDMETLQNLVQALHSRGIREKVLQKQIQKHVEDMSLLCANNKAAIDLTMLEKQKLSKEMVENWCVEEHAMKVDIALLQQVEALEKKVIAAGLHVKGWNHSEPQSDREDLVYHEHKSFSPPLPNKGQRDSGQEEFPGFVERRPNNPLDIAVTRLAELERHIERNSEEEVVPGMRLWRKAVAQIRGSAQLSLCIQQLQKSIAWERAIMKVHCQLCERGDNEDLLLLCDGCDKGCHTYCHKPKITTVPEGDWFCPACTNKESGQSLRGRKQQSRTAGGGKRSSDVKRNGKPSVVGELINEEDASSMPKKGTKEFKKRKTDDSPPISQAKYDTAVSCAKKAKIQKDDKNDLATCRVLIAELETHQDAWPFLNPVDLKAVPGYKKVIKKPMDFSTIREKLNNNQYSNLETFIIDVNLVFDNCERFNEDDSEIGRAGHNMRRFFDERWTELLH